jgi:hypothetical protein
MILTEGDPEQRDLMRASGRKWVFKSIAAPFNPGLAPTGMRSLFFLHTCDILI